MNVFAIHMVVGPVRSTSSGACIEILIFVAIAVFYLVGTILKAKRNAQQQREQGGRKPEYKPPESIRRLQQRFSQAAGGAAARGPQGQQRTPVRRGQPQRQMARPQAVGQKVAGRKYQEQATAVPIVESLKEPELGVSASLEEFKEPLRRKPAKKPKDQQPRPSAQVPQAQHLAQILSAYADRDGLKRAILHYEILGKPVSLRSPSERIMGL